MKAVTSIVAGTAVLLVSCGTFAAQAMADPTTPAPLPITTAAATPRVAGQTGVGWFFAALTDVQRKCLADAAVQRPAGKLTDAQRKNLRVALDASLAKCEVKLPDRFAGRERFGFGWAALTSDQQQCLAGTSLTRPVGRLTAEQRAAVRKAKLNAATACGVGR